MCKGNMDGHGDLRAFADAAPYNLDSLKSSVVGGNRSSATTPQATCSTSKVQHPASSSATASAAAYIDSECL